MDMYQPTVTDLTDYDPFLDPANYMYNGMMGMGAFPNHARRSNSRSGYRLFARVSNTLNRIVGPSTSTRMPPRESVYMFFSQFGNVLDCYLPESATNVAYLCFEDEQTMESILQFPPEMLCIEGVYVTLSRASPRPDYSMNNTDRVFVKNCPDNINRADLRNYFQQFGLVTDVYIPKDKITGEQKKFAFVTFANVDSARSAISFGDVHRLIYIDRMSNVINTVPLQVMPAEPRPNAPLGMHSMMFDGGMSSSSHYGGAPSFGGYSTEYSSTTSSTPLLLPSIQKHRIFDGHSDAFTTANSTVATNTPTSANMSMEAAASVLISALSQLDSLVGTGTVPERGAEVPQDTTTVHNAGGSGVTEIDDILAKLSCISLADTGTPELQHELMCLQSSCLQEEQTTPPTPVVVLQDEESFSRQSSAAVEVNIFEQFLNPSWEQRE